MEEYLSEKEKWERVKAQVRESAPTVLLAIAVVAVAIAGWRWWQGHLDEQRIEAGGKYTQMLRALGQGNRTEAMVLLGELEREYPTSPYADQARLLAARVRVDDGDLDRAANELTAVAQHSTDKDLALVARLRLARVQIAQRKPDDALATLGTVEPGAFAAAYHEVRGDAYYAKGDKTAALGEYRSAQAAKAGADARLLDLKIADLGSDVPVITNTATSSAPRPGK